MLQGLDDARDCLDAQIGNFSQRLPWRKDYSSGQRVVSAQGQQTDQAADPRHGFATAQGNQFSRTPLRSCERVQ